MMFLFYAVSSRADSAKSLDSRGQIPYVDNSRMHPLRRCDLNGQRFPAGPLPLRSIALQPNAAPRLRGGSADGYWREGRSAVDILRSHSAWDSAARRAPAPDDFGAAAPAAAWPLLRLAAPLHFGALAAL